MASRFEGSRRFAARLARVAVWVAALSGGAFTATPANAVPAYARQTGQDCIACHVGGFGPQLTPFGRAFKLSAFTLGDPNRHTTPLSAMLVASYTHTATDQPPASPRFHANNNFTALQQASIFFAGPLTEHSGMFAQATYSDTGVPAQLAWDNTEYRYAHDYKLGTASGTVGLSVNNNPTLSDVWNTVPAWQFSYMGPPFGSSGAAVTPQIYNLGGSVIGASAYTLVNGHWYGELGAYHTLSSDWADRLHAGNSGIQGEAPYWRFWYSDTVGPHVFEAGVIGMNGRVNTGGIAMPGPTDNFRDIGADATYQFLDGGPHLVTANFIYMHEHSNLDQTFSAGGSSNTTNSLDNSSLNLSYWFRNTYGATLGLFNSTGSADPTFYGGSATGSPDTSGAILEVDWNPFGKSWANPEKNLRIGLQYTLYTKFMGARENFDGQGTNARDMNTLYLYLWTAI